MGTAATGVRVEAVTAGGPAEAAGLRRGDILIRFGARRIETLGGLQEALATLAISGGPGPGHDGVEVVALRGPQVIRAVAEPVAPPVRGR